MPPRRKKPAAGEKFGNPFFCAPETRQKFSEDFFIFVPPKKIWWRRMSENIFVCMYLVKRWGPCKKLCWQAKREVSQIRRFYIRFWSKLVNEGKSGSKILKILSTLFMDLAHIYQQRIRPWWKNKIEFKPNPTTRYTFYYIHTNMRKNEKVTLNVEGDAQKVDKYFST